MTTSLTSALSADAHPFARRTANLAGSEVRALFAVASRPDVVSLAGGMPFVSALPTELVADAMNRVVRERGSLALQYGSGQGRPELREQILDVMGLEGIEASAADVVVTTGSQHALELISKLFLDPGDVVIAEAPSYVTALVVFRSFQAEVEQVPMDEYGLIPEALCEHVLRMREQGKRIKFVYTIPNFSNPAGVTLSLERRHALVALAHELDLLIVEDNPYGLLYFDQPAPPALRAIDAERIVYLGTFSKTLAAGVRIGWALAPHPIREKLVLANEAAVLSPSDFTQHVVSEYLASTDWKAQIDTFRSIYRERRDALLAALEEHLPDLSWTVPNGGFYVWLTLPEGIDSREMLPRAVSNLVAYTPGTAFYANGGGSSQIRLSFCYPEPDFIREGIRRLARTLQEEQDFLAAEREPLLTGPIRLPSP